MFVRHSYILSVCECHDTGSRRWTDAVMYLLWNLPPSFRQVHTECKERVKTFCSLGEHRMSVLPPSAVQRSDAVRKGMWEVCDDVLRECGSCACLVTKAIRHV